MLRRIFAEVHQYAPRYFIRKKHDSKVDQASFGDFACETEYYCKQDRKLLTIVKEKTQDEIKHMQREVQIMQNKIEEYNRGISESLRFLKDLEKELSTSKKT